MKEKTFYGFLCCCPSGPLMIDATTRVRGYTPGQTISVKINVFNDSREHVEGLEVKLIKVSLPVKRITRIHSSKESVSC